ncbi:MAG: hypothetical protein CRU78_06330 [Candidatus Accumulibacter phosphatis]|uniref:Uncharacterized protein n=1 Tax=Candidatus Accumulibacter phosphatis TaxID=327160 RepID=A0A6A7RRV0_9PROT|nr:hypothetical protein [Candidatus Accumulibacter phosphatis]
MKMIIKPIALAVWVATAQLANVAYAQAPKGAPAAAVQPASPATPAALQLTAPEDWIIYENTTTYTPVLDDLSRHLDAARKAFDAKDNKKAATEMRAAADELKKQAARADKEGKELVAADQALLAADQKFTQDAVTRINASATKVSAAASAIESGKITRKADLDQALDTAARADLDRRWVVTDVSTWYPVSEEPQRHFTNAVADYGRKEYTAAAAEIRKATGYLRLEAGRASGQAKQALDRSVLDLDKLAPAVAKGSLNETREMDKAFAEANQALAQAYRAKADESWVRHAYERTGYELKAAAHSLEGAAGWVGSEAKSIAASTVAETRALGDKLASGTQWTRDEVAKGLQNLASGIHAVGQQINPGK